MELKNPKMHEKSALNVSAPEEQLQQQQQEKQQQKSQQPQEKQSIGNKNEEEERNLMETQESKNGGKHEVESFDKEKGHENGGIVGPRERLKKHRREVAGQVWIPDMWGQEDFLKDWIDCNAFDASLVPQNIMLARASLIEEGRRSSSNTLRVENSC